MKTIKMLAFFAAALFIMSSCTTETAEPTITWEGNVSQFHNPTDGDYAHTINLVIAAEAGITDFIIWKHVYRGINVTTTEVEGPEGFENALTYNYEFNIAIAGTEFTGGVTKVVYEFEVKDAEVRTVTEEFTVFVDEMYKVTFVVNDEAGEPIEDAIITFNEVTYAAGVYVTDFVEAGTYAYSVTKAGYVPVNVAEYVVEGDQEVTVVMEAALSAYSADVPLALISEVAWATYMGTVVGTHTSDVIGFAFTFTDGAIFRVAKTANCDGWVLVDAATADAFISKAELATAYAAGDEITTYDLPATIAKAFEVRYFIAKFGTEYKLVKYVYGYRNGANNTGNVIAFQYKS